MLNNRDQRHGNKIGALEAAELTLEENKTEIPHTEQSQSISY